MKRSIFIGFVAGILSMGCSHTHSSDVKAAGGTADGGYFMAYGKSDPDRACLNEYSDGPHSSLVKMWGCILHTDPAYVDWRQSFPSMERAVNAFGFYDLDHMNKEATKGWPEFVALVKTNGKPNTDRPFAVQSVSCDCVEKNAHFMVTATATMTNGTNMIQILKDSRSMELCKEALQAETVCNAR